MASSVVNGVRAWLRSDRHRYQPLASPPLRPNSTSTTSTTMTTTTDIDGFDLDDEGEDRYIQDPYRHDGGSFRHLSQGRSSHGRASVPLLYQDPHRKAGRHPSLRTRGRVYSDYNDGVLDSVWAGGNRRFLKLTLMVMSLGLMLYMGISFSYVAKTGRAPATSCDTIDHGYQCYPTIAQSWGQYSPFFSVPSEVESASDDNTVAATALPPTCRYTFAQVLSRHGGRDPTAGKSVIYGALLTRILETVKDFADGPDGRFGFLKDYKYRLGADELTRFGELQMVHSGAHFFRRYRSLIDSLATPTTHIDPFVRSAGQHRVVLSAIFWVQGFQSARRAEQRQQQRQRQGQRKQQQHKDDESGHQQIVLLPEESGFNNTLSYNGLCKKFTSRRGSAAQRTFAATFVPDITARLNRGLPGANLTDGETIDLMDMCPYETIADEHDEHEASDGDASSSSPGKPGVSGGRRLSPFCHLFSEAEWRNYDYYQTLGKWYGFGDGSELGATQGVGFVNELIARLTQSPVDDHTSTNRTMDADPATFPLNATMYADFSHDNDMANVFAALGLYGGMAGAAPLEPSNTTRIEPGDLRGFAAGWTVPFAARMYVEKMVCGGDDDGGDENEELVRVLVNDRVIPLENCGADALGRCRLSRFVDSLAFARRGGDWEKCFE